MKKSSTKSKKLPIRTIIDFKQKSFNIIAIKFTKPKKWTKNIILRKGFLNIKTKLKTKICNHRRFCMHFRWYIDNLNTKADKIVLYEAHSTIQQTFMKNHYSKSVLKYVRFIK